jgi:spore germination protein GerM
VILRLKLPRAAGPLAVAALVAIAAAALVLAWPRWRAPAPAAVPPPAPITVETRTIKATLYFVAEDGAALVPVERDVPFGEGTAEQAKRIIESQVAQPPAGQRSAIPPGTSLRALFLLGGGQAYVDLTREVAAAHPGGTLNELLTVYTIVEALTTNLPAITSVHLLVDGREVDTLAGHVDLRRPLRPNAEWVHHDSP